MAAKESDLPRACVCVFALAVVLATFHQPLQAQVGMAQLNGTVSDPTGAPVPNASVILQGEEEKSSRRTVTGSVGEYVIPAINPGKYQLRVEASGFQTQVITDILLGAGQASTLNVGMKLGQAITTVNVAAVSPLLQTATATVGSEVSAEQFTTLPMLGRNFTTLITTLPGAGSIPDWQNWGATVGGPENNLAISPSVYGQRQRDNDYTLDGVYNNDLLFAMVGFYPPPEAIAEMKVASGMDSGAYGWAAGADINVVTKSGTNEYHGDAWEFVQNNDLQARSYFAKTLGMYRWNQFGGTFGGPLKIPHLLSKARAWYVFADYEGIRDHGGGTYTALVPTAAQLAGNFTGSPPIYNPYSTVAGPNGTYTRTQFPGNIIPTGSTSLCAPQPTCIYPASTTLASEFWPLPNLPAEAVAGANYLNAASISVNDGNQWSGRVDHQFGQKDNFYARYSDSDNPGNSVGLPSLPTVDYNRFMNVAVSDTHMFDPTSILTVRYGMTRINYGNFTGGPDIADQLGTTSAWPPYFGDHIMPPISLTEYPALSQGTAFYGPEYVFSWTADVQKIKGKHMLAFGGGFVRESFLTANTTGINQAFTVQATSNFVSGTGFDLASFLLGLPATAGRLSGNNAGDMHGHINSLYVQDTFHATRKLTVNMGLRWDYAAPFVNNYGSATFDFDNGNYYWDKTNPITGAPPNIRRGLIAPDRLDFQPRFGLAYQLGSKTVARASFGLFYDGVSIAPQSEQGNRGNWPFAFSQSLSSLNAVTPTAYWENPFPGPATGSTVPLGCTQCQNIDYGTTRYPRIQEYTASIQRQLTPSTKLQIAYFGSHGIHLSGQLIDNVAEEPGTNSYTLRQPWPQWPVNNLNNFADYWAHYNGGSIEVERRYSRGLTLLAAYTYANTMDVMDSIDTGYPGTDAAAPDRYNIRSFYGPASSNFRHRATLSYDYEIPVHSGSRFLNGVIAHWSHSGILSLDSGPGFFVIGGSDFENIGSFNGRQPEFPNLTCNPNTGYSRSWSEWFNTACYSIPAFGTAIGNAGKHVLYGDPEVNWNASFFKRWPFGESKDFEFRAEFYNLPNASTFNPPNELDPSSTFGEATGTRQSGRNIQFGLKFHF